MNMPEGWKLVPVDPTEEMLEAIDLNLTSFGNYIRLLAAAPTPPAPEVEPVAWVEVKNAEEGPYEFHGIKLLDSGKHNLYTHPANDGLRKAAEELIAHGESGGAIFDGEKHFDRLREEATKLK